MIKAVVNFDLGCYEQIYEPSFPNPTWDFYTFTDLERREHRKCSNEYFFEPLLIESEELEGLSSKRKASYFKAQALTLLQKFINTHHTNHDISMPPHPDCESYLQEVEKIRQIKAECGQEIETEDIMEETLDIMTLKGYKFDNGFHESTMSIRTNNKRVKSFEKSWAKNYLAMPTKRDQASLSLTRYEKKSILFNTLPNPLNHTWQEPFFRKAHKYNEKGSNKL